MTIQDDSGTHVTLAGSEESSDQQELPRGSSLGRYVIIEPIGSGGMGTVYRAYDPQLNRGVALKILSVKQADPQAAEKAKARLIREAQALAQLSHPNVVAVHDAGTFEDDVFIAMELVEGKTLDEWMRAKKKSVKRILEVMIAAGRGLSAAHKAGLIHRDFKPGNVIVGEDGRVRVLDFGLARAAEQEEPVDEGLAASEKDEQLPDPKTPFDMKEISSDSSPNLLQSPLTNVGGVLGTPLYMAPEQHLGLKTDERTDQFGFCVVLYEVLYGKRPFAARSMEELKCEVIRQRVSGPMAGTDVPGWLWQIVYRGLSAKPDDRYPTIDLLLDDLDQDPEEVRRQKRLARRKKLFVTVLVVFTIALPIGVWYGLRYRTFKLCMDSRVEFEGVWDDATKSRVKNAFLNTKKHFAQETWERVEQNFDKYRVEWAKMRSDVCHARLIQGTQSEELFDLRMGCLKARKRELKALINVFYRIDSKVVEKAVQASSSLTGIAICDNEEALRAPYPPPTTMMAKEKVSAIRKNLAEVTALDKTGKYREGSELAIKLKEEAKTVGYLPAIAETVFSLGQLLEKVGEYKRAEAALYESIKVAGECKYSLIIAKAMLNLVFVVGNQQARHKEGLSYGRSAEAILAVAGNDDVLRSRLYKNLGVVHKSMGDYGRALSYYEKALSIQNKVLGLGHPGAAAILNNQGAVYYHMGKYNKALEYWSRSKAILEKTLGQEHPHVAMLLNNMGGALLTKGENDTALDYYRKALAIRKKALGPEHPDVAMSLSNIGEVLRVQGQYNKAHQLLLEALVIWKNAMGPEHPLVAKTLFYIGDVLDKLGEYDNALEYYQKSLAIKETVFGPEHPSLAEPLIGMGRIFLVRKMQNQALASLERVVSICAKKICQPELFGSGLFGLAKALATKNGDSERAIRLAKQAREEFGKDSYLERKLEKVNAWLQVHGESQLAKKATK